LDDQNKIYWHEPIFEGLTLVLDGNNLNFQSEIPLSEEALIIDALVTKAEGTKVNNEIGRIFRGHNLFEFKSEKDSFSIYDYAKVIGYAGIYSSQKKIPMTDITISIMLTMFPRELVRFLEDERSVKVQDIGSGIYYIRGESFNIQLIESKRLSEENLLLRNLRSGLSADEVKSTFWAYEKKRPIDKRSIYLSRLIKANPVAFEEAYSMVTEETVDIILGVIERSGQLEKRLIEDRKRTAKNMLSLGMSVENIARATELPIETVQSLV